MRRLLASVVALSATVVLSTQSVSAASVEMPPIARLTADQRSCRAADGYAATFDGRRTFFLKPGALRAIKAALSADPDLQSVYAELIRRADAALAHRPPSVMDKTGLPPSGDRHDYMSLAPYWWPDPAHPGGPYVRRDGEVNPERATAEFDRVAIGRFGSDVTALSLAYYYSGERRYAEKAAAMVRTWFLDPATAMNPNARFAQAVPGREAGRAEGVLDTSGFEQVIDGVGLIAPAHVLTGAEQQRLERWFSRYIDWMSTSPTGLAENSATNNHGMWFDSQIADYALFARRTDVARKVVEAFPARRIGPEFDPSGRLPAELTRTRSFHYSIFALMPAYDVADLAACLGYDLWNYRGPQGQGLRRATDFVAAYRGRARDWPYHELRWDERELDVLLTRANAAWGAGAYAHGRAGYPEELEYRGR